MKVTAQPFLNRMNPMSQILTPTEYHLELRDYLKTQERELWDWFASAEARANYAESLRLELLNCTSRLDPDGHGELCGLAEEAKSALHLDVPLILYQVQQSTALNATLYYLPQEAHLVLSGPVQPLLRPGELKSVLGHALARFHLWRQEAGEFLVADRLLQAMAGDPRAEASHRQSARWYRLYTEIYADRGAWQVVRDLPTVIAGLVKMRTGLAEVSAASYLEEANKIFQQSAVNSKEISPSDAHLRSRALALWIETKEEAGPWIRAMIEGNAGLDELDLTGQARLTRLTRRILTHFLGPKWFQTEAVLAHARLFFPDFQPALASDAGWVEDFKLTEPSLRDYLGYLLLDFVTADPKLDELPLAAALEFSRQLDMDELFEQMATKELKLKARDFKRLKEQAVERLSQAESTR